MIQSVMYPDIWSDYEAVIDSGGGNKTATWLEEGPLCYTLVMFAFFYKMSLFISSLSKFV